MSKLRLFHFLSALFLSLSVCEQNNKPYDAALIRGNTESVTRNSVFNCCCAAEELTSTWSWNLVVVFLGFDPSTPQKGPNSFSSMANLARNNKILLELVQRPGNNVCADCSAPGESTQAKSLKKGFHFDHLMSNIGGGGCFRGECFALN